MRMKFSFLLLTFCVFVFTGPVFANPLKLESRNLLLSRRGQEFITVVNTSDKTEYFRVIVRRVTVNNKGEVEYETKKNPRDLGLLVVPVNLKLASQQKRKLRVVSLLGAQAENLAADEHVYFRVEFDHVTKDKIDKIKAMEDKKAQTSGMSIFIDAKSERAVIVDVGSRNDFRPATSARFETVKISTETEEGKKELEKRLVITNSGNVLLWLTGFEICDLSGQCEGRVWFKLMYPGEQYFYTVDDNVSKIKYVEKFGSAEKKRVVVLQ
ncbi:MAG: hypothetical protein VX737_06000 [Pseudomonadota bacterium]|nr:hypothetical protein [Pseudomonadota bacterium]